MKKQTMETFLNKEGILDLPLDQSQVQLVSQEEEQDQANEEGEESKGKWLYSLYSSLPLSRNSAWYNIIAYQDTFSMSQPLLILV